MNKLFKLFYGFAAMMITALAVSCSSDDLESVGTYDGSTVTVSLNVTAPDALETTRALSGSSSAYGGLSNVDLSSGDYVLRYQLKIYEVTTSDDETTLSLIGEQPDAAYVTDANSTSASFSATLTSGSTYKFVVWADFVEATSSSDEGTTTTTYSDLHYDTSDATNDGWTITCIDDTDEQLNDESRDAYFACSEETISSDNNSITIKCSRPFAKIRLVTTDWEEGKADAVSIQYYSGSRFTNIDLLTGASESEDLSSSSETYTASIPGDAYADGVDAEDGTKTLVVDYLMTDISDASSINFTYTATLGETTVKTLDITTPIQRNYLTTVNGALLGGTETTEEATTNVTITCSALDDFEETELEGTINDDEEEEEETVSYISYTAILHTTSEDDYSSLTTTYYGYYSSESASSYTRAYYKNYDDSSLTGSDGETYTLSDGVIYDSDGNKAATVVTSQSVYDGSEVVELTTTNNGFEFSRDDGNFAVVITGNSTKTLNAQYYISVDGAYYKGIKCSNGAQNTLYLPDGIYVTEVTIYSLNAGQSTDDYGNLKTAYWKEFNGDAFTTEHNEYTNVSADSSTNCDEPDEATFTSGTEFDGELTGRVTFTNTGSQPDFVIKVTYNKHEVEESTDSTEE